MSLVRRGIVFYKVWISALDMLSERGCGVFFRLVAHGVQLKGFYTATVPFPVVESLT